MEKDKNYMKEAIKEAYEGIEKKHGGPFGSVIVKDGKIVGKGHNQVLLYKMLKWYIYRLRLTQFLVCIL